MNKIISIEKFPISLIVITILASKSLNDVHERASLKTLNNLTPLKAEIAPPP